MQHDLHRFAVTAQTTWRVGEYARTGYVLQPRPQPLQDLRHRFTALVPQRQRQHHLPRAHIAIAIKVTRALDDAHGIAPVDFIVGDGSYLIEMSFGVLHARALGRDHLYLYAGTVFGRRELLRQLHSRKRPAYDHEQNDCRRHTAGQAGDERGTTALQRTTQQRLIASRKGLEEAVDGVREAATAHATRKQLGSHHGRQRQGHQRREHHGRRYGHTELAEQAADVALQIRQRQKHRRQHQGGGDDRKADLPTAVDGGDQRVFAQFDTPNDVL